jgi:crossover junction endodeoxyribonuclease RuvC
MTTLALDLGTTTGWAAGIGKNMFSGVWNLKPGRFEGGGMRFLKFQGFLNEVHKNVTLKRVVFEEVRRHAGTDAAHVYGGLMGTLTAWCEENKIPYEGVPVGTIKKFWTGNGAAKKEAMIAQAVSRGFAPRDDNEADALALLHFALGGGE